MSGGTPPRASRCSPYLQESTARQHLVFRTAVGSQCHSSGLQWHIESQPISARPATLNRGLMLELCVESGILRDMGAPIPLRLNSSHRNRTWGVVRAPTWHGARGSEVPPLLRATRTSPDRKVAMGSKCLRGSLGMTSPMRTRCCTDQPNIGPHKKDPAGSARASPKTRPTIGDPMGSTDLATAACE